MSYSLSFTKSILVVIFISDKIRQGQFEFLSTKMISKILDIPKPTLVKILQNLHAANIIETKEGKSGGIRLAKNPTEITVLDILHAMEKSKPLFQTSFNILAEGKRPNTAQQSIKSLLGEAEGKMKTALSLKNIQQILEEMDG
ncbi:MAG: RrF2 family transcriptional regulator [Aureispira sp.]